MKSEAIQGLCRYACLLCSICCKLQTPPAVMGVAKKVAYLLRDRMRSCHTAACARSEPLGGSVVRRKSSALQSERRKQKRRKQTPRRVSFYRQRELEDLSPPSYYQDNSELVVILSCLQIRQHLNAASFLLTFVNGGFLLHGLCLSLSLFSPWYPKPYAPGTCPSEYDTQHPKTFCAFEIFLKLRRLFF